MDRTVDPRMERRRAKGEEMEDSALVWLPLAYLKHPVSLGSTSTGITVDVLTRERRSPCVESAPRWRRR